MSRSIPLEKAMDDALLAYGQNGEAIRPEQGYPLRLMLPGWEGNSQVKWLRRLEVSDRPTMTRDETSKYTDPLADGTARQFSFVMDAKSVITFPSSGFALPDRGWWEIKGLAWSGRGRIIRVEVSTDGGRRWTEAALQGPVLPKCTVRFRHLWEWDGGEAQLLSRATDETGYVQPTVQQLWEVRGERTTREPASVIHNDYTDASARRRLLDILPPGEAQQRLAGRFAIVNVWRSIRGTVWNSPLALCDASTLARGDLVAAERRARDRIGELELVSWNPAHRWYYFREMDERECLLIKTFDSARDGRATRSVHTAFDNPLAPADAPPRESIESRVFVFFE